MTVVDQTAPAQTDSVVFEFDLSHPPEKVWRALTDPALLSEWLMPVTGFAPVPGTRFALQIEPQPGWEGTVDCELLEFEQERRLRFSWAVPGMGLDTVVTFALTPTPSGTRLLLEQAGFKPDQQRNFGGARYGWRMMGGRLVDLLERTP
jgi:uncharacterized protein YndB with AHSA1/START domain